MDKNNKVQASLNSKTRQNKLAGCRTMDVLEENVTGDLRNAKGEYNYVTPSLYASLFFTKGSICGESNIVSGKSRVIQGSGIEKAKEQIKQLTPINEIAITLSSIKADLLHLENSKENAERKRPASSSILDFILFLF